MPSERCFSRRSLLALTAVGLVAATTGVAQAADLKSVVAKLVEIPGKYPEDDLYKYGYVMKYEVVSGDLPGGSTLYVVQYRPKLPRKKIKGKMKKHVKGSLRSFSVGDVHKMEIDAGVKKRWTGPIVDEYFATDRETTRYWGYRVDPN